MQYTFILYRICADGVCTSRFPKVHSILLTKVSFEYSETYRSGHNGAHSKTNGHFGNPSLKALDLSGFSQYN